MYSLTAGFELLCSLDRYLPPKSGQLIVHNDPLDGVVLSELFTAYLVHISPMQGCPQTAQNVLRREDCVVYTPSSLFDYMLIILCVNRGV